MSENRDAPAGEQLSQAITIFIHKNLAGSAAEIEKAQQELQQLAQQCMYVSAGGYVGNFNTVIADESDGRSEYIGHLAGIAFNALFELLNELNYLPSKRSVRGIMVEGHRDDGESLEAVIPVMKAMMTEIARMMRAGPTLPILKRGEVIREKTVEGTDGKNIKVEFVEKENAEETCCDEGKQ